jgi:hypothetical protein
LISRDARLPAIHLMMSYSRTCQAPLPALK